MKFKHISLLIILSTFSLSDIYDGYTLYTPGGGGSATTYLRDSDWNIINTWSHDCGAASMPYLVRTDEPGLENSLLYYPCQNNNPIMESGGVGGQIKIYNWDGNLLWSYTVSGTVSGANSSNGMQHHHDIQPLPNGNVLIIAWERLYSNEWQSLGVSSVNNSLNQMWSSAILEVEPNFNTGGAEIVWEWYLKDHLIQDYNPSLDNYGIISEHPELMDANCGSIGSSGGPGGDANGDWMHFNAIDYNEDLDQIVLSSRFQDEIYIIDHSTTTEEAASHSGGNSGMGGDFLYRWGNPQNYDRGNNSDQILDDQHSVNWIDIGSPGEGNLILFNNNHGNNASAGLELMPPINEDGTYRLDDGIAYAPLTPEWLYYPGNGFHTSVQGGCFRLPNGNTLLTEADDTEIREVTYEGIIVWEYDFPGNNNSLIARADKYAIDYFDQEDVLGDLNYDNIINVLDVIILVNMAIDVAEDDLNGDMNGDGGINILDVVILVGIILN